MEYVAISIGLFALTTIPLVITDTTSEDMFCMCSRPENGGCETLPYTNETLYCTNVDTRVRREAGRGVYSAVHHIRNAQRALRNVDSTINEHLSRADWYQAQRDVIVELRWQVSGLAATDLVSEVELQSSLACLQYRAFLTFCQGQRAEGQLKVRDNHLPQWREGLRHRRKLLAVLLELRGLLKVTRKMVEVD